MATFVPTTPLLVSDQAVSLLAKTVVETTPGVFALNTVGGGVGSEIPIKLDTFNGSLATFVPTTPLLVSDQAGSLLAKAVVETTSGVLALNTIGGGGGIPIIKFDMFNGTLLSEYKNVSGVYYYPDYYNYQYMLKYLNKELNIISLTAKNGGSLTLGFNGELVFYEDQARPSDFSTTTIPFNYQPVGLPE